MLLPYIETYWTVHVFCNEGGCHKILPDGCVDIIFSFTDESSKGLLPFVPNVIGTMTSFTQVHYPTDVYFLGIRFKPVGITAFVSSPIHEFTDHRIDLTLVDSLFDNSFHKDLPEKKSLSEKIKHIDGYFLKKLKHAFKLESQIVYAVDLIKQTNGLLSPAEIASKACLSTRHFERKFKSAIGVAPKTFCKVIKFKHTMSYLKQHPSNSLYSVAIECGYFDHAHMIKEFKFLSGDSPSLFRS
jgi:AraC-like DNA-binding protein